MKQLILFVSLFITLNANCRENINNSIDINIYHNQNTNNKNHHHFGKRSLNEMVNISLEDNHLLNISELSGKQVEIKIKNDSEKEVYTSIPMYVTSPAIIELGTLPHGSYTLEITVDDCVYQGKFCL